MAEQQCDGSGFIDQRYGTGRKTAKVPCPGCPRCQKQDQRGFDIFAEVTDTYGQLVRVKESSSAAGPRVWIFTYPNEDNPASGEDGPSPHLDVGQARIVRNALSAFIRQADPDARPDAHLTVNADDQPCEVLREITVPRRRIGRWTALLSYRVLDDESPFLCPWMEYSLDGGLASGLGYTCASWSRDRLMAKIEKAEREMLGFDRPGKETA